MKSFLFNEVVWSKPTLIAQWDQKGHREENWIELFYDLLYVAVAIAFGEFIKYQIKTEDPYRLVAESFIIFWCFYNTWFMLQNYLNRFFAEDFVHKILYLTQCGSVLLMGMFIEYSHVMYSTTSKTVFVVAFCTSRLELVLTYFVVLQNTKKGGHVIKSYIISYLLEVAVFIGSIFVPEKQGYIVAIMWCAGLLIETLAFLWTEAIDSRRGLPVPMKHMINRIGIFVMIMIGESLIQIVANSGKFGVTFDTGLFAVEVLFVLYVTAQMYYELQPHNLDKHAFKRNQFKRQLWTWLHVPLSFSVLFVGISVKLILYHKLSESKDDKKSGVKPIDIYLLAFSLAATWTLLGILRFAHKGLSSRKFWKRLLAYGLRLLCSVACFAVPFITTKLQPAMAMLVAASAFLWLVDIYSRIMHELRYEEIAKQRKGWRKSVARGEVLDTITESSNDLPTLSAVPHPGDEESNTPYVQFDSK